MLVRKNLVRARLVAQGEGGMILGLVFAKIKQAQLAQLGLFSKRWFLLPLALGMNALSFWWWLC